jgi:hypothetical protein
MSLKLTRLIDIEAKSPLESLIGNFEEFSQKVTATVENLEDTVLQHYRDIKLLENIHAISDTHALFDFKCMIIPPSCMKQGAEFIQKHYPKDPIYIQVTLYLEVMQQLHTAGEQYVRKLLQQRVQALAEQQKKSGIILPSNHIIT